MLAPPTNKETVLPLPNIVVVASAYGVDQIIKRGHATILPLTAAAGADGIEIRRELFHDPVQHGAAALGILAGALKSQQLYAVYSAPTSLFLDDGQLNLTELVALLSEAEALSAVSLKLQLGRYLGELDVEALRAVLSQSKMKLLIENGQLEVGGKIADFAAFFALCQGADLPVGMTFDVGNWLWAGEDPLQAAQRLAPHVHYIHFKAVRGQGMQRLASAPDETALAYWRTCLSVLPSTVARGIEYPFPDGGIGPIAAEHVAQLRAL